MPPAAGAQGPEPTIDRAGLRPPERAVQSAGKPRKHVEPAWEVVDDLPERIPVMQREIKVIETYLGGLLDEPLAPKKSQTKSE